ncbi:MAG: hypothetical protein HY718_17035 [Planctomycetes bacterium]|nr:hypothetical protein [Planctomycetota bacterium]
MKQWKKAAVVVAVFAMCGAATAATIRDGGDPDKGRVLWADPFDWYTQWNYDNASFWTGGPTPAGAANAEGATFGTKEPTPACADNCLPAFGQIQTVPSKHEMARAQWITGRFIGDDCGPITSPGGVAAATGAFDVLYGGGNARCGAATPICYGQGQTATTLMMLARASYTWGTGGSYDAITQFTNDLTPRIQTIAANKELGTKNAVNGSDADPLVVTFELRAGAVGNNHGIFDISYVELSLGDETAPMDYIWRGDPTKTYPDPDGCPQGPYPVLCQQAREINEDVSEDGSDLVYLNNNCPNLVPESTKVWASFAFGFNALLDKDPCGVLEQGVDAHKPTKNHWAVFDVSKWREIRAARYTGLDEAQPGWPRDEHMNVGGGPCGDFGIAAGINVVYMKIITDYVLIYVKNTAVTPNQHWGAAIPRIYKGPFNKIRWGGGKGCELWRDPDDPDKYECKPEGTPFQCLTYSQASPAPVGYQRTEMDTMAMYIGTEAGFDMNNNLVYVDTINGACCKTDGTCEPLDEVSCANAGGRWDGVGTACGQLRCCPQQYGDTDKDDDVDMDDFALLQQCMTVGGGPISSTPGCECLDSEPDGDIDLDDAIHFATCASGAEIQADPACRNW